MRAHSDEFENYFPLDDKRSHQRYHGEKKKGKLNNNESSSYKRYIELYRDAVHKYRNFNFRRKGKNILIVDSRIDSGRNGAYLECHILYKL